MQILAQISKELKEIQYSVDAVDLINYGKDWTDFYPPNPTCIFFPKTTKEVQQIVQFAVKHNIGVVPSGGRTGLSGGAVAYNNEIVISLDKMNKVLGFNSVNQSVEVEAGLITEELQIFAENKNLYYPLDFASKGSSQIGGNIATNAGGIKVVKYGLTRNWVIGLEIVTGKGEILQLNNGLLKNATGYDLRHLFIGSEGTLGIITKATIQLTKKPKNITVLLFAVPDFKNIIPILERFRNNIEINAFEFFSDLALTYSIKLGDRKKPLSEESTYYVLIEYEKLSDEIQQKVEKITIDLYEKEMIVDDIVGQQEQEIRNIWAYRENIAESLAPYTPYKNDVSVLTSDIPYFIEEASAILQEHYPNFDVIWYGHIADGNIHINILKPKELNKVEFKAKCDVITKHLFTLIKKYKGSISAEHGVGLLKKNYLNYSRSEAELVYLKVIKDAFDPTGIMNPGKLL